MRYAGPNAAGYERDIVIVAEGLFSDPTYEEAQDAIDALVNDYGVSRETVQDDLADIVEAIGTERTGQALNFTQS